MVRVRGNEVFDGRTAQCAYCRAALRGVARTGRDCRSPLELFKPKDGDPDDYVAHSLVKRRSVYAIHQYLLLPTY